MVRMKGWACGLPRVPSWARSTGVRTNGTQEPHAAQQGAERRERPGEEPWKASAEQRRAQERTMADTGDDALMLRQHLVRILKRDAAGAHDRRACPRAAA